MIRSIFQKNLGWRQQTHHFLTHLKIGSTLLIWLPSLLMKRWKIQSRAIVPSKELEMWFEE